MADSKLKIWISDKVNLSGIKKLQSKLKSLGTSIKKAFNSKPVLAFNKVLIGTAAAFTASVVEAAKFNVQIARVWTMAGGGIKNFRELREEARGLASDFGLARSEIAGGMYNALSAGIDRANLEGFMTQAAKVAVADGSDISTAVDGITTVLNAFKVEAAETESVTDDLFQTVAQGKTTFGELSAQLATVAPVAAASNIPLKQILAHIATLTAQGTPTAQATTQIRQSIIGLNKALGDGWSATMSYQEALKAVWKQSGESQTALLKLVGSTEAVQAVLGGVGINAEMAAQKLDAMSNSAGAAQAAFEKVDQFRHWPTLLETARGTLSKFGEDVDQRLAPYVDRVTDKLREWREDPVVWAKIEKYLDKAEKKLQEIEKWFSEIHSLEDLKMAGIELGQKFTDYVVEKAKDIGAAMAQGMWDGIKGMVKGGFSGFGEDVADFMTMGQTSKIAAGKQPSMNPFTMIKDWLGFGGSGESVSTSVKEGVKLGFEELMSQREQGADISIDDLLAAGPTHDQLLELHDKMKLNSEEFGKLVDYMNESGESAKAAAEASKETTESVKQSSKATKKTAEEAKKSSDANVEANKAVQQAMTQSTTVSQQTLQVAQNTNTQLDQLAQAVSRLAGQQAQTNANVEIALGQIANMRM